MRLVDIQGNVKVYLSNEELNLLEKIKSHDLFPKKSLSEHEQELARRLIFKQCISRIKYKNQICFLFNGLENLDGYY